METECKKLSVAVRAYYIASFPGSPLAPTKNKNEGGEPGTHDFALTIK